MGNAAKAIAGIELEPTSPIQGLVQLIPPTAVASFPLGLTVAIPATARQGMRIIICVQNHTATGTIALTGTAPLTAAAVTETLPATGSIPLPDQPGDPVWRGSVNGYAVITASTGITITGLTNGIISVFGVQVARRLIVGEIKLTDKNGEFSPMEQRGSLDENYHVLATKSEPEWEFAAALYIDDGLWLPLGGYSNTYTVSPVPAAGVAVLAATSVVTGSSASAALQPSAPGMVLQGVISGTPTTNATVTIAGINIYGEAVTETLVPSSKVNGTYTSVNVFKSINASGITYGAFGGAASLLINGYFCWNFNGSPGDTLNSYTIEQYDSTSSMVAPFCLVDEWAIEGGIDKEAMLSGKGPCQAVIPIGDLSSVADQDVALAQIIDKPLMGWRTVVWIDAQGGTPGTTQNADLIDYKVTFKINWIAKYTAWGAIPYRMWNRAYRKRRKITLEVTLDMTSATYLAEYDAWKRNRRRIVQIQCYGPYVGTDSGNVYYQGFKFIGYLKWQDMPDRDLTTQKESVEIKLHGDCEVSPALGYSHNLTWYSRLPGW